MVKRKKKKDKRKLKRLPKKLILIKNQQQHQKKNRSFLFFFSFLFHFWKYVFGIFGLVLGIFALYHTFFPSVSITPANELNIKNPCHVPFIVKNENIYTITMIDFYFFIEKVTLQNGATIKNLWIKKPMKKPIKIFPKIKITKFFILDKIFAGSPIKSGTVSVEIRYETPWYYPNKNFEQFYRIHIINNRVYWTPLR